MCQKAAIILTIENKNHPEFKSFKQLNSSKKTHLRTICTHYGPLSPNILICVSQEQGYSLT